MDINGALSEIRIIVTIRTGAEELNGMFKVLTCCRELSRTELNETQYEMSSREHRRGLGLLGHGKDPLRQFSRQSKITPPVVRQRQERLHQLGILSQLFAQLTRANESVLEFWCLCSGHEQ